MSIPMYSRASADNFRLAKSKVLESPADEQYDLIPVPRFAFIYDVWFFVKDGGSSDTVQVGFVGNGISHDADYFLDTTYAEATAVGMKRAGDIVVITDNVWIPFNGLWLNEASGMVTVTVGTAQTSGEFVVFAAYSIIH
jgi:hypothetical protein